LCRIIEFLCEHGADCTLTDIEGNTAHDVAVKNGQNKARNALLALMKIAATNRRKNGTVRSVSCEAGET